MKHNWIEGFAKVNSKLNSEGDIDYYLLELLHNDTSIFMRASFNINKKKMQGLVNVGEYIKFEGYINLDLSNYLSISLEEIKDSFKERPTTKLETTYEYLAKVLNISSRKGFGSYKFVTLSTEPLSPSIYGSNGIRLVCGYDVYSKILLPIEDSDVDLVHFKGSLMRDTYNDKTGMNKKLTFIVTKATIV